MVKILFICHGSTSDSRELAALVGQNTGWAGRKTLVHRTAGNFPVIFILLQH